MVLGSALRVRVSCDQGFLASFPLFAGRNSDFTVMLGSVVRPIDHDAGMDSFQPNSGGPRPRHSFTPSQKLVHVNAYLAACAHGGILKTLAMARKRKGTISGDVTSFYFRLIVN